MCFNGIFDWIDIDGMGNKQIKFFWKIGYIQKTSDIFKLKKFQKEIINSDGWGEVSYFKLIKNIQKSKSIDLQKFIYSLGIRYVGEINSQILSKHFFTINNFLKKSQIKKHLEEIDGLGPKAINSINQFLRNKENINEINELIHHCRIKEYQKIEIESEFNNIGYDIYYKVYMCSKLDIGVPQNRERLILVGIRSDLQQEFTFPEENEFQNVSLVGWWGNRLIIIKTNIKTNPK